MCAGDVLYTVNGKYVVVEQVQHEILESPVKVYNFRVADNHTYFVGDTGIGVHNANYKPAEKSLKQAKGKGNNFKVNTKADAIKMIESARPNLSEYPAYTKSAPKSGYEFHPAEPNVGNDMPHIKWWDWSNGKANGGEGHIFFND